MKWRQETEVTGGHPTGGYHHPRADWQAWIETSTVNEEVSMRSHMLLQFSSNAGIDTREKAEAIVAKVLAGLNAEEKIDAGK